MRRVILAPRRTFALAALVLAAAAAFAVTQLAPSSPERLLARDSSPVGKATNGLERSLGGEPIVVDVRAPLAVTLSPRDLTGLLALEHRIARVRGVQTVVGPGTFVDQSVVQMNHVVVQELGPAAKRADAIARKAVALARADGVRGSRLQQIDQAARLQALGPNLAQQYEALFVRFGTIGIPSITNPNFVDQLVMGASTAPKKRFAWLFPDRGHALIVVRVRSTITDSRVRAIGGEISRLVAATRLPGVKTTVAGAPLVVAGAGASFAGQLVELLPLMVLVMLVALLVGLGLRARAVHLILPAGAAALLTAALGGAFGLGLTPATLAALPVIMGLALDYAVQLQGRYWARREDGTAPREAALAAVEQLGPTLLLSGGAMGVAFLVLLASPVPLIGRLGLTLTLGVVASLASVFLLGAPLMVAADRPGIAAPRLPLRQLRLPYLARMGLLGVVVGLAIAGTAVSGGTPVQSDVRKLASPNLPELTRLESLQRDLGTSGQLRVDIEAPDVTAPKVLTWMSAAGPKILRLDPRLQAGPNLADILTSGGATSVPDAAGVRQLLRLIPSAFVDAVLTPDHRRAELSFGVPLASAAAQAKLIARMQRILDTAPAGVHARVAGLLAVSAAGVTGLEHGRPWLLLLAAVVVLAMLYAVRRRLDRALIPLVPAVLVAGIAGVVERLTGLHLSPLSAGLDPLVLGVGVEFGLLIEAAYHEHRERGADPAAAARLAAERLGATVSVSAVTVALGFAVLAVSALPALRQFGVVAAVELVLCVIASIVLVPGLSAAADRRRERVARPVRRGTLPVVELT